MDEVWESYFKYVDFMYEATNIGKCALCPENCGNGCACNPCGLDRCVIEANCEDEA